MKPIACALLLVCALTACNTMDGLVTDVDRGVSRIQGEEPDRRR